MTTSTTSIIDSLGPFPSRRSAEVLREQLVRRLLDAETVAGDPFPSDLELARATQLSRGTVRKALDELHKAGWIERRQGLGTFVGPRAGLGIELRAATGSPAVGRQRIVRLAVVIQDLGHLQSDWYTPGVLQGIDARAGERDVVMELLGDREGDVASVSRRLAQSRPDVLAVIAPPGHTAMVLVGDARRVGIPVLGTGTLLASLGVPTAQEDGWGGAVLGVRHLVEQGHRRIGFVTWNLHTPLMTQRLSGFADGLERAGLAPDAGRICHLDMRDVETSRRRLGHFLADFRPTALFFSTYFPVQCLAAMVAAGELSVPRDLSVLTFDQNNLAAQWLGGVRPTTVALPLAEMGRWLVDAACDCARDGTPPPTKSIPCTLVPGDSVTPPPRGGGNGNGGGGTN